MKKCAGVRDISVQSPNVWFLDLVCFQLVTYLEYHSNGDTSSSDVSLFNWSIHYNRRKFHENLYSGIKGNMSVLGASHKISEISCIGLGISNFIYRASRSTIGYRLWRIRSDVQCRVYQTAHQLLVYGDQQLPGLENRWKLNTLLEPAEASTRPHSANDFADYFTKKVTAIYCWCFTAIWPWLVPPLGWLNSVTLEEVVKAIQKSPSKQCDVDLVSTWLVKKCCDILGSVITGMINVRGRTFSGKP